MVKTEKQTLMDIESLMKKREKTLQTKVPKTDKQTIETIGSHAAPVEASTEGLAEDIVAKVLQQLNKGSIPAPGPTAVSAAKPVSTAQAKESQVKLKEAETRYKMATMMMKLSKKVSILCILLFILPFVTVLVTMMDQEAAALIISMVAMIYPALLFANSLGFQRYLSINYGLKPLLPQQQQMMPGQQQTPQEQQLKIPNVPYGIHNQPGKTQQNKQKPGFF